CAIDNYLVSAAGDGLGNWRCEHDLHNGRGGIGPDGEAKGTGRQSAEGRPIAGSKRGGAVHECGVGGIAARVGEVHYQVAALINIWRIQHKESPEYIRITTDRELIGADGQR